jgi:SAM-dependent methyltransferase
MSLLDTDDLTGTVNEIARVLRPGGHLRVALVHPMASPQDPETMHTREPKVSRPYLEERRYEDRMERDELLMTVASMHRPLGTYIAACAQAGLLMEGMREFGAKPIPWLLTARFTRSPGSAGRRTTTCPT